MKVLIDTNVLISAVLKPDSVPSKAMLIAARNDEMFFTTQNIQEFLRFLNSKRPNLITYGKRLLEELNYTLLPIVISGGPTIRDDSDQPILNTAIATNIDVILTGDKDFLALDLSKPKSMRPSEYLIRHYMTNYETLIRTLTSNYLNRLISA